MRGYKELTTPPPAESLSNRYAMPGELRKSTRYYFIKWKYRAHSTVHDGLGAMTEQRGRCEAAARQSRGNGEV